MSDTDRPEFTRAEKSAAWDWLRRVALDDNNPHAQVAIVEWQAFFNALRDIANDPDSDARRLTSVAVDALTHGDPSFANVGRKDAIHDMKARLAEVERLLQEVYDGRQSLMSVGLVYRIGHTLNHRPADSATHRENERE